MSRSHPSIDFESFSVQLDVMLKMQAALNAVVFPDWAARHFPWHRAIYIEAAEYLEQLGTWKWWKMGTPNIPQAQMELVDIWHFALSWYLMKDLDALSTGDFSSIVQHILKDTEKALTWLPVEFPDEQTSLRWRYDAVDELVAEAAVGVFSMASFVELVLGTDMHFDLLYKQYVGKNVLNRFRQENGYKTGFYTKSWDGIEDNEYLEQLLQALPSDVSLPEKVHQALTKRYGELASV